MKADILTYIGLNDAVLESDDFRMYHFKIKMCSKGCLPSQWATCGYAHHGEKARRRDPRLGYISVACPDMLKYGKCPQGDACRMAHSAFEFWLHPQRYRTEACRDGESCTRPVCFFAHNQSQLRKAEYPTTDAVGNPLPRPKFALSRLTAQQQPAETVAAGQTIQQSARQASNSNCSFSRRGSLDFTGSAMAGVCMAEQWLLPFHGKGTLVHSSSGSLGSGSNHSNFEVYPMLSMQLMRTGSGIATAADLIIPTVDSNSSSSSSSNTTSRGYVNLLDGAHPPYSSTYCSSNIGSHCNSGAGSSSGMLAAVAAADALPSANVLLPALIENADNMQQQVQLAQQAANAANGQLAALYNAIGISSEAIGSSSGGGPSTGLAACRTMADLQMFNPTAYGCGIARDVNSIGSLNTGHFACLRIPEHTGGLQAGISGLNVIPMFGVLQHTSSAVPSSMHLSSAALALLPPRNPGTVSATSAATAMLVSSRALPAGINLVTPAMEQAASTAVRLLQA